MRRPHLLAFAIFIASAALLATTAARADDSGGGAGPPAAYDKWTAGKTPQPGLFPLWRNGGKVYMEIASSQLDKDFIEQAIPVSGLGGWDITPGNPYYDVARDIRFTRVDDTISITWPNTSFIAPEGSPEERAVETTFAPSVVAVAPIVAEDATTGKVIMDASALLGDVSDFTDGINQTIGISDPLAKYALDPTRTYFGPTEAFPDNDVIEADQTFASAAPPVAVDNVPDPRSVQLKLDYNILQAPSDGYMPRVADERVGFYPNIQLQFGNDSVQGRQVRYILRWSFAPADPTKPSDATHPMVFYLSDTIPMRYHDTVRDALLEWNKAFEKIGITNAIQVRDQPDDPAWNPDDLRYNVVRWLTESNSGGFAQAGSVWDPRTGQLIHVGVVLDADLMYYNYQDWGVYINAAARAALSGPGRGEDDYGPGMRAEAAFGKVALTQMGLLSTPAQENQFDQDFLRNIVLHESGHEMGLEHNFIGSEAYTAKELQSRSFTSRYGIASTVMEYAPMNVWPKGTPQGTYWQTTIGPYDYYAIHWGYAYIPGAADPQAEVPTLKRWASTWSQPEHRFAMDEDVWYFNAHAIDPRVSQNDLSNDDLGWCSTQMDLARNLMQDIGSRFEISGQAYDPMRNALGDLYFHYDGCAYIAEHWIGGEYVDRSHAGDPGFSGTALSPAPRADEQRAFGILDKYMFSDSAFAYPSSLLRKAVYTEWVTDFPQPPWAYSTQPRHDVPIVEQIGSDQAAMLQLLFQPLLLQRLDDLSTKYAPGSTMSLADLFDWMQSSAFGDLDTKRLSTIPEVHRNLQQMYARMLSQMVLHPADGTPYDAQSLARMELKSMQPALATALTSTRLDTVTRAHLESLSDLVTQTLEAKTVVGI
jgi:hypothetical protein